VQPNVDLVALPDAQRLSVLFIGLDNVYRSPAAQAVAKAEASRRGETRVRFDSAGTSWRHAGQRARPEVIAACDDRNYCIDHVVRRVHPGDFGTYDLMIVMDSQNMSDLERVRGGMELRRTFHLLMEPNQVQLLRRWDPFSMPGDEDLLAACTVDEVFDVLQRTIPPLLDHLQELVAASS
jgi:protein-tyrosine-phosphatase